MATRTLFVRMAVLGILGAALPGPAATALADDYPQRPITLVVGIGAGGAHDVNTRIYAEVIGRRLGQRVIVENKAGSGGAVAASAVQNAAPDGYTLLVLSALQHAYVAATQPGLYAPIKGFAPISLMFEIVSTLAVPTEMPVQNVAEFIAYGRKKPAGLTVGAPGSGTPPHMFGVLISERTGMQVQVVQYRGSSQAMTDLVGGRIDFAFPTYAVGLPFITQKTIRPIAVAAERRWSEFPELPTLVEAGLVKQMVAMWYGLVAPAGTPAAVIDKLQQAVAEASRDADLMRRLGATGTSVRTSRAVEMRDMLSAESSNVESMINRLGLRQN